MTSRSVPLEQAAIPMWIPNLPVKSIAALAGKTDRWLWGIFAESKNLPIQTANKISSFSDVLMIPNTSDHVRLVKLSRTVVCRASSYAEVVDVIGTLSDELKEREESQDHRHMANLDWGLVYAHSRAAGFAPADKVQHHNLKAQEYANAMGPLLKKVRWDDPFLMRVIERRNWASANFIAESMTKIPEPERVMEFIHAYDDSEGALGQAMMGLTKADAAQLPKARLPLRRAIALDRVELSAHTQRDAVIDRSIDLLRDAAPVDDKSAKLFSLVLDSIPSGAREKLGKHAGWNKLRAELDANSAKHSNVEPEGE